LTFKPVLQNTKGSEDKLTIYQAAGSVCLYKLTRFVFVIVNRLEKNVKYVRNLVPSLDQRGVNIIVHYLAIQVT